MQRVVFGLKRRIRRSEEPVRMYWPVPEEKERVFTGLGGASEGLRRANWVVGKSVLEDMSATYDMNCGGDSSMIVSRSTCGILSCYEHLYVRE